MIDVLGPEAEEGQEWGKVPPHVFRVMSNEEYRKGMRTGFFKSDERNNWRAQQRQEGNPNWREMPEEGTVGGVEAEIGYLPVGQLGRVVKFDTSKHSGWEVHPDVPEGDYIRTKGKIPAESVVAVTKPVLRTRNWF